MDTSQPHGIQEFDAAPSAANGTLGVRSSPSSRPSHWRRAAGAAVVGALFGGLLAQLLPAPTYRVMAVCAVAATLLVFTRLRRLAWPAAGLLLVAVVLVTLTPLVKPLEHQLERNDPEEHAPAIIVLGGGIYKDGTLTANTQERVLHGYGLLARGEAPLLVLTRPPDGVAQWDQTVRQQMSELGLRYPVEAVGPALNTHDEALAVAAIARERGWGRVILVTDPWHMRRAAATFEKAGVRVICSPCVDRQHDLHLLEIPDDRLAVFRLWVRETCGYWLYKWRGWV